jgi:prepilin-type processing-associated H-X9-DG protein
MTKTRRRNGLTLIELLVIVAVAVILAAVLLPVNTGASEKARRSACLNNLKQIGLSVWMYAGDFGGRFPCDAASTTVGSFALLTNGYQTAYKTWMCPSDTSQIIAGSPSTPFTSNSVSYAYGGFGLTTNVAPDRPIACDRSSAGSPTVAMPWQGNAWTHKSDGGNVLHADGHVAFTKTLQPPMVRGKNP